MTKLRRKQRMTNVEWIEAVAHIEELVSREEIDNLASETIVLLYGLYGGKAYQGVLPASRDPDRY